MQHLLVPYLVQQGRLNNRLLRVIRCLVAATIAVVMTIFSFLTLGQMAIANTNSDDITSLLRLTPRNSPLFASQCDYQTKILADNPIAYWRFGETSGVTAINIGSLGNAVDGTYQGGVTLGQNGLVSGDSDTAASFDGINDRVKIPDNTAINSGGPYNNRTIELWFKANTVSDRQILFEEGGEVRGMNIYIDAGKLYVNAYNLWPDGGGTTTPWGPKFISTSIAANTIYHAALVFQADTTGPTTTLTGTITGYLNGVSFGTVSGLGQLYYHYNDIGIGGVQQNSYYHDNTGSNGYLADQFNGIIDEVVLFNDSLTSAQIQDHATPCPAPGPTPAPVYLPIILVNS